MRDVLCSYLHGLRSAPAEAAHPVLGTMGCIGSGLE